MLKVMLSDTFITATAKVALAVGLVLSPSLALGDKVCREYTETSKKALPYCLDPNYHSTSGGDYVVKHENKGSVYFKFKEQALQYVKEQKDKDCYDIVWVPSCKYAPKGGKEVYNWLPIQFEGTWVYAPPLAETDWKESCIGENNIVIGRNNIETEAREGGCKTIRVTNLTEGKVTGRWAPEENKKDSFEDVNAFTAKVELKCYGEGASWRSSELWHVQSVLSQRQLTITTLKEFDWKSKKEMPHGPRVRILLECPRQNVSE